MLFLTEKVLPKSFEVLLKATNITEIGRADRDMEQHLAASG